MNPKPSRGPAMNGERSLWAAVLLQAIEDAVDGARLDQSDMARKIDYTEVCRRYLTTPSRDLAEVCGLAGVDMEMLIERMVKRIAAAPAPEELFARRRSRSKTYELDGEHLSLAEWSDRHGMSVDVVRARMRKGMGLREALAQ